MQKFRDRPIRQKITLAIMTIATVVLLLAFAALFCFQAYTLKQHSAHELAVVGEITAHNCAAAVMFKDEDAAAQIVGGLKTMPQIVSARLELLDQETLAFFGTARDEMEIRAAAIKSGFRIEGDRILVAKPVVLSGTREGTLYLIADLRAMTSQLLRLYGSIFGLVLVASLFLAFVLSSQFLRFITDPILRLAGTARTVADRNDHSVRAQRFCGDEVGDLTDAFNQMLDQIESQDRALRGAQLELQEQVNALQREVSERQHAEAAKARLTAILEATPDVVISADPRGTVSYFNRAARQIFGFGKDKSVNGLKLLDFHPAWAREIVAKKGLPSAMEHGSWAGETAILNRAGEQIDVSQVLFAHKRPTGEVAYISTVMRDITAHRRAEEALRLSQQRLLETSRLAGMAEVATGVLHNVGNVLNSVNVSASVVAEKLRHSKAPKVAKAAELLTSKNGNLADYLSKDPSGQKFPGYLAKLGEFLTTENAELLNEVHQLSRNIEHIKEVVAMQQSYAKVSGVFENLPAQQLVDDAVAMNIGAFKRHGVHIERRYSDVPPVCIDRHKVLQILINLLRNAKYALDESKRTDKRITVSITAPNERSVHITVADNGIGISPENLTRVFAHGFTTRKEGHGFGLHSGALAARAMGGSLSVASAGIGHGATFTLELPVAAPVAQT